MKFAVLASETAREEVKARIRGAGTELIFVDSIEDLQTEEADIYFDLGFEMKKKRVDMLASLLPKPVFVNAVVETLDEIGHPFVRINAWPGFFGREMAEIALPNKAMADNIKYYLGKINWHHRIVPDTAGMISGRIIAMIINEAFYTVQENISTEADIDVAMKLGTGYPYGPFEWGRQIGLKNIHALLLALQKTDKRYTIAASLEAEARGG